MIVPTRRAVVVAAAAVPVALLAAVVDRHLWGAWAVASALGLLLLAIDAALAVAPRHLVVRVEAPERAAVGASTALSVHLTAPRDVARLEVLVEVDPRFEGPAELTAALRGGQPVDLTLPLRPRRRGTLTVDEAWLRWTGPLGLASRQARVPVGRVVLVAPNLAPVRATALRFFGSRDAAAGVQVERYIGDGTEFDALREYVPGLDPRAITWKASARHRRLLVQEFRAERNHQVILALDTGHLMAEPLEGVTRLDHAVTSALLLAYVSLRLGDRVGLFGFDRAARVWTAPQGGIGAFARLQAATAALDYSHEETNFTLGLTELSTRLRRRSLVVVFTDFADTVSAELMLENVARLARRQLVLFVALRDPSLDAIALGAPERLSDVYRAVVASDLTRERERVLGRLRRMGVLCLDAAPSSLSTRLVNRYLDVKRRELVA